MLYISSACIKRRTIKESVEELARGGFANIELSGGTDYYADYKKDLLALKRSYGLNYVVHNYFPPPREHFILNLASLDDEVYNRSIDHCLQALLLCRELGSEKFGLHAGYFIDFSAQQIGKEITANSRYDRGKAVGRFCEGLGRIKKAAAGVQVYVENNVLSSSNTKSLGLDALMMMDNAGYRELKKVADFKLLLDVAHLRVSALSLGFDFEEELNKMLPESDYVHVSDNDGLHDQSRCFSEESAVLSALKGHDFAGKTITSETYGSVSEVRMSQSILTKALGLAE